MPAPSTLPASSRFGRLGGCLPAAQPLTQATTVPSAAGGADLAAAAGLAPAISAAPAAIRAVLGLLHALARGQRRLVCRILLHPVWHWQALVAACCLARQPRRRRLVGAAADTCEKGSTAAKRGAIRSLPPTPGTARSCCGGWRERRLEAGGGPLAGAASRPAATRHVSDVPSQVAAAIGGSQHPARQGRGGTAHPLWTRRSPRCAPAVPLGTWRWSRPATAGRPHVRQTQAGKREEGS